MKLNKTVVVGGVAFLVGAGLGVSTMLHASLFGEKPPERYVTADVRDKIATTYFTNPLLECAELPEHISIGDRVDLQKNIENFIANQKARGILSNASVYYRDLTNGPWFGINEDEPFTPASLLKVPLAMWYYAEADKNPEILEQEIEFNGPLGSSVVHFPPRATLEVGKVYTIDELIHRMLAESDNDATKILGEFAANRGVTEVYQDLGVKPFLDQAYTIDVHTYASFFRILYNATYLGRSLSEHILEIMSTSGFTKGLVAGVPASVPVSHKFGEKTLDEAEHLYQLHDCGVVYAASPYILCVMTQGKEYGQLANVIKDISSMVYKAVK